MQAIEEVFTKGGLDCPMVEATEEEMNKTYIRIFISSKRYKEGKKEDNILTHYGSNPIEKE